MPFPEIPDFTPAKLWSGAEMISPAHAETQIGHFKKKMKIKKNITLHVIDFIMPPK